MAAARANETEMWGFDNVGCGVLKKCTKTDRRPLRPDELVTFTWTRALDLQTAAHALRYATPLEAPCTVTVGPPLVVIDFWREAPRFFCILAFYKRFQA